MPCRYEDAVYEMLTTLGVMYVIIKERALARLGVLPQHLERGDARVCVCVCVCVPCAVP